MNSPASVPAIGQPLDRRDGRLKVTGGARYSAEMNMQGLAHGVIVPAAIAKGRVEGIDAAEIERLPGVIAILTPFNTPKLPDGPGGINSPRPTDKRIAILQDAAVHYVGQPVAVVVAETFEQAVDASARLGPNVRYAVETPALDLLAARGTAYEPKGPISRDRKVDSNEGDVEAGLAGAAQTVRETYGTPMETHCAMEPHATTAVWEAPDRLTIFDATQGVHPTRKRVAAIFGLPAENVRVICHFLGGGFGSKGPVWAHTALAAVAARQVGRPVKIALGRRENFPNTGFRPQTVMPVAFGATADGKLTALRHDVLMQTSDFDEFVEPAAVVTRLLYDCPNIATSHRLVKLNYNTPNYMRAPGEASGSFPLECALDELAYKLKLNPLELRLRNYAESDPSEHGKPWSSKNLRECYRVGAERFGWGKRSPEPRATRTADGRQLVGYGMATATYPVRRSPSKAVARMERDGRVVVQAGTQDLGTGTYTVMAQIAADAVGVPAERVRFELGDTEMPETPVSGGSQTCASTGSAVQAAGRNLRRQLVGLLLDAKEMTPELADRIDKDYEVAGGGVRAKSDPDGKLTPFTELLARTGKESMVATGEWKPGPPEQETHSMHSFGAQFCEVHVDPDLGTARVARWVGVFSAGRMLNAKTARSQLLGGIVFGIGMALHEETVADRRLGRLVNANLADYHIPVNADVPEIDVTFLEESDTLINPVGVKGIGEIGIVGVPAALGNAIFHATGIRVRDLPITPDKLLGGAAA